MSKKCSVEGCEKKHYGKGYCQKHYNQIKRHGHILERTIYDPNEIIEHEDYAEIILHDKNGNEKARAMIDLECIDLVKRHKWTCKDNLYVHCSNINTYLHRFLMNPSDDLVVDHINRNPLDNRRCNLRVCTQQENQFNHSIPCNNTSGVMGVSWNKNANKWTAQIHVNGKVIYLGAYNTKEEAIDARRQAEIEYFGEFSPSKE